MDNIEHPDDQKKPSGTESVEDEKEVLMISGITTKVIKDTKRGMEILFRASVNQTVRDESMSKKPKVPKAKKEEDDKFYNELKDFLDCPICASVYEDPYVLRCGHTFCKKCIVACQKPFCPLCKEPMVVGTTNFQFQALLEKISEKLCDSNESEDSEIPERIEDKTEMPKRPREESQSEKQRVEKTTGDEQPVRVDDMVDISKGIDAKSDEVVPVPTATNKKRKKAEFMTTTHVDYHLCGPICREITSPLISFTLKICKKKDSLWEVIDIISSLHQEKITYSYLKKCMVDSQYFKPSDTRTPVLRIVNNVVKPLSERYYSGSIPFDSERNFDCILNPEMLYIIKNIFKTKRYFKAISDFGVVIIACLSEFHLDIIYGNNPIPKRDLFKSLSFDRKLEESSKKFFIQESQEEDYNNEEEINTIWDASQIFHKLKDNISRFGDSCIIEPSIGGWKQGVIDSLSSISELEVLNDTRSNLYYVTTSEISDCQTKLLTRLLNVDSIDLYSVDNDYDIKNPDGFFQMLRTIIKKFRDGLEIYCPLNKRKEIIRRHARWEKVISVDDSINREDSSSCVTLVIDRAHTLSISDLQNVLSRFNNIKSLHLFGSISCYPEQTGQPFFDLWNAESNSITRNTIDVSLDEKKICGFFNSPREALKTKEGEDYYLVVDTQETKKSIEPRIDQSERQNILTIREFSYNKQVKNFVVCLLQNSNLYRSDIIKIIQGCSFMDLTLAIVGTKDEFFKAYSRQRPIRKSFFPLLIAAATKKKTE